MRAILILAPLAEVSLRFGEGETILDDFAFAVLSEAPFFPLPFALGEVWESEAETSGLVAPGGGALTSGRKGAIAQQVIAAVPAYRNYECSIQTDEQTCSPQKLLTT